MAGTVMSEFLLYERHFRRPIGQVTCCVVCNPLKADTAFSDRFSSQDETATQRTDFVAT